MRFLILILCLFLVACTAAEKSVSVDKSVVNESSFSKNNDPPQIVIPNDELDSAIDDLNTLEGNIRVISITAKQWEFLPNNIEVNKGETVILKIKSIDVPHGFYLADFNLQKILQPNEESVIEFVADKSGTFDFMCIVPCGTGHKDMKGKLVVK